MGGPAVITLPEESLDIANVMFLTAEYNIDWKIDFSHYEANNFLQMIQYMALQR